MKRALAAIAVALFFSVSSFAQKAEVALTVGGYFPINSELPIDNAFAIEGNVAVRFAHVPLAALYVEVPITGTFSSDIFGINQVLKLGTYSAIFVTPGVKLKLAPSFFLSPYVAVGGGLAHFSTSGGALSSSSTDNKGAFDIAGGLDIKIFPYLSLRGEIRDYYSGTPELIPFFTQNHNQLLTTGGLVVRF